MPSLTRDEAATRASLLTVDSYEILLDLGAGDLDAGFASTSTVRFGCAEPGAATFADVLATEVTRVRLNGAELDPASVTDGRLPLEGLAADNELVVEARMAYSTSGEGVHHFTDPEDGEVYLYAMSGMDNARRIFACFDQPDLKARIALRVAAPEAWTVWANGAPIDWDGVRAFADTERMSTYLMTLVAGPYATRLGEHDGIRLGVAARRSLAEYLDADAEEILRHTRASFDWYHANFGTRYPFGNHYFQAFVPEFNWGAVENPGCVTFSEDLLFRGAVTESERQDRAVIIAHEMAHMWFGDLVTLRWWDDIWLNESFAEYMGWRVAAEATEFTGAWTGFAVGRKAWGYTADQRSSTHPVAPDDVPDTASALSNFDGISYAKGAGVLRQLAARLGDEAFLAGLRGYFARHAYGNASLADFLDAFAGHDLDAWAELWLRRAQVNTLRPETTVTDGRYTSVTVVQTAPERYPTLRPHRLGVAVHRADGTADRAEIDVEATERTPVPALEGAAEGLILLNDGDLSWAKVRFDDTGRALLPSLLPGIADSLARALIWSAATDAVKDAEMSTADYLALAAAALPGETEVSLFEDVSTFITNVLLDRFVAPAAHETALASARDTAVAALAAAAPGTGRQLAAARMLIETDDGSRIAGWLRGDGVPEGLPIGPDLRWSVLVRLAAIGHAGEESIAAETRHDPSAKGAEWAARARAALTTPADKAAAWKLLTEGAPSGRLAQAVARGFHQPGHAEVCDPYTERYFTDVLTINEHLTPQSAGPVIRSAFPRHAVEPATLALAEKFLTREDLPPVVRRSVADVTDDLRRALAVRDAA
ncbi:aminopeptidase [Actinorhabdospora filicis]|uniref:Aminopeptidase N n=1 Tax=Actinorhabdospora filicis TaxID=1785913 RepID=A0A9W6SLS2_9ACTN|nr:aminopeptidase N [Actinorhabdospora filicis]GLZ79289.1 aminopeptidase [Actinorhabdospora filicis]